MIYCVNDPPPLPPLLFLASHVVHYPPRRRGDVIGGGEIRERRVSVGKDKQARQGERAVPDLLGSQLPR